VNRPDLQTIAPPVNAAFAGRQTALTAAFRRQFPNGLGQPVSTTADAHGTYFLHNPPGVPGFVRCHPPDADNLVLTRFVRARRSGERLTGQDVTPATTVISRVVTQAIRAGLDPVPIQDALLASIAPLTILLPDHPHGNGLFATVQLLPGATLSNPGLASLAFTATAIFDAMRQQRANTPADITFVTALTDYFQDAAFQPALAPLAPAVNAAVDQGQAVIGIGRSDISSAASTATLLGSVTNANGAPLAGVQVVATQQNTIIQSAITDANGAFTLANVPPGSTTVTATLGSLQASMTLNVIAVPAFPLTLSLGFTAPPPTLSAVSPASGPTAGGTALPLTGTNFQVGATVTIGGSAATAVTITSATRITATTPSGRAGAAAVVVTNPDGQSASLATAFVYLSLGSLYPGQAFALTGSPSSVAAADLNGDGKSDLITANNSTNNVSVLLGNGDGTFRPPLDFGFVPGSSPRAVAVKDVNSDGRLDLITANSGNNVSVLLGNGNGTFQAPQSFTIGTGTNTVTPTALAVADVNSDGRLDIITVNIGLRQ